VFSHPEVGGAPTKSFSLPPPPRKMCWPLQKKKKNKKFLVFFCPNSFDYNVFGLESFIELIFLISSIDT